MHDGEGARREVATALGEAAAWGRAGNSVGAWGQWRGAGMHADGVEGATAGGRGRGGRDGGRARAWVRQTADGQAR